MVKTAVKQVPALGRLFQKAIEAAYDAVLITDAELELPGPSIVYANPAFSKMTGYSLDELIGKTPRILQGPETDFAVIQRLRSDLENGRQFEGMSKNYRKDGSTFVMEWTISPVLDDDNQVTHYVAVQRDVSKRERSLEMLRNLALLDDLTGCLTRAETQRQLTTEIQRARRYKGHLSVIMFDIDDFKSVNDEHGHNAGDQVLRLLAETVQPRIRTTDLFGRWGGDEFVVILPQTKLEGAMALAEDLRIHIERQELYLGLKAKASFGVAALIDETETEALIDRVDQALYAAKNAGRNQVFVSDPTMQGGVR